MTKERKIEGVLQDYFYAHGWSIDTRGDHIASRFVGSMVDGEEIEINLTKLAQYLASDLPC